MWLDPDPIFKFLWIWIQILPDPGSAPGFRIRPISETGPETLEKRRKVGILAGWLFKLRRNEAAITIEHFEIKYKEYR